MRQLRRFFLFTAPILAVTLLILSFARRGNAEATEGTEAFPKEPHELFDFLNWDETRHIAYGQVTEEVIEQPIAYSHQLHAGTLQINCEYCHSNARRTIHAGVPPTQTCMGCHRYIDTTDRPELVKLKDYADKGEPIPWVKVHDVPDFVYFSHKRHVAAGVDCTECHGNPAQDMTVAQRVNTLQMGWCLNCHKNHPSVDANYGAQAELRRAEMKDCYTCHK